VEREERARRAVTDERLRIARELHDVVAHHVSVMGVQAGAARRVLAADPDRAAEALAAIEESGRQAVGELQKLVGFLRSADETNGMAPQPTMDDLPRLLDQTRATGLPVELRTIGAPRPVTASVALSIYRIVQEGLTNALKHAGPVPTTVVLTYGLDSLDVEIVNARGTLRPSPGGGRGLLGMRERVAMLGGRFEAGATTDGGFRVAAGLPTMTPYEQAVTPA
jgi:signal transduction histidine kinase